MLARELKERIEHWSEDLRARSKLLALARNGGVTPRALGLYLRSLAYVFLNSQRHLVLAAERSASAERHGLSAYFREKSAEEVGHHRWADEDLMHLPQTAVHGLEPAPAAVAIVGLQRELIECDPLGFLAYALWAEYFTVLLGDEWVQALAHSGYEPAQLTAVTKHVEADRAHAVRALRDLDCYVQEGTDAATIFAAIERAQHLFEAFCDEVYAVALDRPASSSDLTI